MSDLVIKDKIYTIRGVQVMLDSDLAELYGVETRNLNKAVKRNINRFPEDFMFQLTKKEYKNLKFHFGTSSWGGVRKLPFAFTEQGVATLSGILKSDKAAEINISIMRAFVAMRKFISRNAQIFTRLDNVERKQIEYDNNFDKIFDALETHIPKQGIFFDGQIFDAHKFVCDLINSAKKEIILMDNYVDYNTLLLFSKLDNVNVIIYTYKITDKLRVGLNKFGEQYFKINIKEFGKSHDRFLIIDGNIYHFGASLKDLGRKWFAFSKLNIGSLELLRKL